MSRAFGLAWRMSRLRAGEDKMAAATDDWNRIDSSEKRANRHCFMLWTIFGGVARGGYFLSSLSLFSSIWFLLDSTLSAAAVCCVFFKVLSQESWVENIFQKSKWGGGAPHREHFCLWGGKRETRKHLQTFPSTRFHKEFQFCESALSVSANIENKMQFFLYFAVRKKKATK